MESITNIYNENLGGNQDLRFAPLHYFTTLNPPAFYPGRDWITIEAPSENIRLTEQPVDDANGGYINTSVTSGVPKIRPEVHALLWEHRHQEVVVECTDLNDNQRRAGVDGGLRLSYKSDTGEKVTDANGYDILFAGKLLNPALFI